MNACQVIQIFQGIAFMACSDGIKYIDLGSTGANASCYEYVNNTVKKLRVQPMQGGFTYNCFPLDNDWSYIEVDFQGQAIFFQRV